ncbi:hypothetical protein GCM10010112_28390 [Actinoplanes lobatus]|uniref:Uncharacterized protein n=1 Tax=Actinoplanes lobatus TaxID=113568 RepID=A0A7W7ML99_9ACTN|nr:hypothetical protein [Actinoplanes lobatus]MBB4754549.1 hypothetical protein [Actinoplanes lobatus]GGN66207.1 hypothetical protein GCM10010112_28390 [Actinoplanes lobatus]GIE45916.1 hypothetical protein Alo02nite_88140 [Actinoplanes lobatus]
MTDFDFSDDFSDDFSEDLCGCDGLDGLDSDPVADTSVPMIDYGSLPVSGDTAALIQQLNGQLSLAGDLSGGYADPGVPGIAPSVQNTLDLINNTYGASPETLNWLNGMNNSISSYGEVSNDVHRYELGYDD